MKIVANVLKGCCRRVCVMVERNVETVFPSLKNEMEDFVYRRPVIFVVDEISKNCQIIEVTIFFDVYFDLVQKAKMDRYDL